MAEGEDWLSWSVVICGGRYDGSCVICGRECLGTDYYLCSLATPWKRKLTPAQVATTALLVVGVALWHAPCVSF
jgi:hypothetical protein